MTRVDLLRDIGLDVETAVILDDELSRLPERTQRVFELRAQGYTQDEIAEAENITQQAISLHTCSMNYFAELLVKWPKNRAYSNRGYL